MIRDRRIRRIFALKTIAKRPWWSKIAGTVHSDIDPKTETEEERWERFFREREEAEMGLVPTPEQKVEMEEATESWKEEEREAEEGFQALEKDQPQTEAVPYREYLDRELASGQHGLISEKQLADKVNYWKTLNVVRLPPKIEVDEETWEEEDVGPEEGWYPGRPLHRFTDIGLGGHRVVRPEEGREHDYLVVNPYEAGLNELYLGAYKNREWYPTRASALMFWMSLNGGKGVERDPSKPIHVPKQHPFARQAPEVIYGLTDQQEKLVLDNMDNLYDNLNKVLPSLEGHLNIPRLNETKIKFSPETMHWELSDTRQQNLLVPAEGTSVRRGDPMRSPELDEDEKALARHLERDVVKYPQLQKALMSFDKEILEQLIDEHIKQRFQDPRGKFEPALFGKIKDLRKDPERMERVRDIVIESLLDKIRQRLRGVGFKF